MYIIHQYLMHHKFQIGSYKKYQVKSPIWIFFLKGNLIQHAEKERWEVITSSRIIWLSSQGPSAIQIELGSEKAFLAKKYVHAMGKT